MHGKPQVNAWLLMPYNGLLQECRDEYYTVDSLNALFETIHETCIVEFLWEARFFYLIWCNLLTSTSPQTCTIWSDLSNYLENESNSGIYLLPGCVGRLLCPEGHVSSLNKSNPTNHQYGWPSFDYGYLWFDIYPSSHHDIHEERTSIIFFFFSQGCEWVECQKRIIVDTRAYLWIDVHNSKLWYP